MVVHTCNPNTWEAQANLGCSVRFYLKTKKLRKIEASEVAQQSKCLLHKPDDLELILDPI